MKKMIEKTGFFKQAGFSLLELMVVVLIIGILASVAVPQYRKAVARSHYAIIKNLAKSIADAEEFYYLGNREYSDDFSELSVEMPGNRLGGSKQTYQYDWGECSLVKETSSHVRCHHNGANLTYHFYFKHGAPEWANKQFCTVGADATDVQRQICQQETGHEPLEDGVMYPY